MYPHNAEEKRILTALNCGQEFGKAFAMRIPHARSRQDLEVRPLVLGNLPAGTKLVLEAATGRGAFSWKAPWKAPVVTGEDVVTTKFCVKICWPGEDVRGADGGAKRRKVSGPAGLGAFKELEIARALWTYQNSEMGQWGARRKGNCS